MQSHWPWKNVYLFSLMEDAWNFYDSFLRCSSRVETNSSSGKVLHQQIIYKQQINKKRLKFMTVTVEDVYRILFELIKESWISCTNTHIENIRLTVIIVLWNRWKFYDLTKNCARLWGVNISLTTVYYKEISDFIFHTLFLLFLMTLNFNKISNVKFLTNDEC